MYACKYVYMKYMHIYVLHPPDMSSVQFIWNEYASMYLFICVCVYMYVCMCAYICTCMTKVRCTRELRTGAGMHWYICVTDTNKDTHTHTRTHMKIQIGTLQHQDSHYYAHKGISRTSINTFIHMTPTHVKLYAYKNTKGTSLVKPRPLRSTPARCSNCENMHVCM